MKKRALLFSIPAALVLTGLLACAALRKRPFEHTTGRTIEWDGRPRSYLLHVPPNLPAGVRVPLVVALHGGGGDGQQMEKFSGFSPLADREGFLVAYPSGVDRNWYDGRVDSFSTAHRERIDDAGFIGAMMEAIAKEYPVDPKRVFATGASNGGFMSHYLGGTLADRFAAIAPVIGGMADPFHLRLAPVAPVSVFIIQGTEDPLVPYAGGEVRFLRSTRGRFISTDDAAALWVKANGCRAEAEEGALPDVAEDGCTVKTKRWAGGRDGSEVRLWTVVGGGHTWPGGVQYLPEFMIGPVCRDVDATEAIWEFFKSHPRP